MKPLIASLRIWSVPASLLEELAGSRLSHVEFSASKARAPNVHRKLARSCGPSPGWSGRWDRAHGSLKAVELHAQKTRIGHSDACPRSTYLGSFCARYSVIIALTGPADRPSPDGGSPSTCNRRSLAQFSPDFRTAFCMPCDNIGV